MCTLHLCVPQLTSRSEYLPEVRSLCQLRQQPRLHCANIHLLLQTLAERRTCEGRVCHGEGRQLRINFKAVLCNDEKDVLVRGDSSSQCARGAQIRGPCVSGLALR